MYVTSSARKGVVALSVLAAAALTGSMAQTATAVAPELAPLKTASASSAVEGSYIVMLKDSMSAGSVGDATKRASANGVKVDRKYTALKGYSAKLSAKQLEQVRQDPSVAYVEQDQKVTASTTQTGATWGLDRIDQRNLPLNGTYTYTPTGAGVKAYIIDTGILTSHSQFSGRTAAGYSAINDGRGTTDCNGHGTHVAGTVGGTTYGVAKGVTLIPVRVLDCAGSGTNAGVIAGMDWVTNNHSGASVANMSLGGGASTAVDSAIARMTSSGVTVAVAAGNENQNACNVSPARATSAITVGSTTSTDARSSFSNYGSCVDVFAPGSNITSAWYTSTSATNTISGTSMASPHVAGVAGPVPAGQPDRVGRHGDQRDHQHLDPEQGHGRRLRVAEPAALLAAERRRHHAPAHRRVVRHHRGRQRRLPHRDHRRVVHDDHLGRPHRLPHRAVGHGLRPVPRQVERVELGRGRRG